MQVYSYVNPVTALLEFKPNFYDLILIDVNMPMIDGFQLAHKLLQKDLNARICFITSGEINIEAAREVHLLKYWQFHQEANFYGTTAKTH